MRFAQSYENLGKVTFDPSLLVQLRQIELQARYIRKVLVVLLENLMKCHEIDIDIHFTFKKSVADASGLSSHRVLRESSRGNAGASSNPINENAHHCRKSIFLAVKKLQTRRSLFLCSLFIELADLHLQIFHLCFELVD